MFLTEVTCLGGYNGEETSLPPSLSQNATTLYSLMLLMQVPLMIDLWPGFDSA